jgi:hypothetical protein
MPVFSFSYLEITFGELVPPERDSVPHFALSCGTAFGMTEYFLGQREIRSDSPQGESLLISPPINIEGVIPNEVRDLIWFIMFIMFILQNTVIKSLRNLTINYFEIIIDS